MNFWLLLGAYIFAGILTAVFLHGKINSVAWMAPTFFVVGLSAVAGLFWWAVLLVLLAVWVRDAVRRA